MRLYKNYFGGFFTAEDQENKRKRRQSRMLDICKQTMWHFWFNFLYLHLL